MAYILKHALTDSLWLSFPHGMIGQPAEVFEFEGNVYSHHLSAIARKHSLIAGIYLCGSITLYVVFTSKR